MNINICKESGHNERLTEGQSELQKIFGLKTCLLRNGSTTLLEKCDTSVHHHYVQEEKLSH